ncbi:ATP-binding protein [Caulobacter sp. KR2-114]|uniref:ATP-binding protein n=1 Tax=Caulobacter sp. KR2-114 TaxID=3400912 RepID=UPI003C08C5FB
MSLAGGDTPAPQTAPGVARRDAAAAGLPDEGLAQAVAPRVGPAFVVAAASAPAVGPAMAGGWLAAVLLLIAGQQGWLGFGRGRRGGAIYGWLRTALYALIASDMVLFYTGAAQTFGVTMFGVLIFQILVRDYAQPRRLWISLAPVLTCVALVQLAAAALRLYQGRPLDLITLFATPLIVTGALRSLYGDLTGNRRRLREAAAAAAASARRAEEAHRFALLAEELAGVGHWRRDLVTGGGAWSPAVFRVYGLDPAAGEPDFDSMMALYIPEDRDLVAANNAALIEHGVSSAFEASIRRPDGEVRRIYANASAERDADGRVTAIFGSVLDVTEARQREAALSESERRYRLLADRATDVIIRYDNAGVIEYASPAVRQFGYVPADLVGRSMADFIHPEDLSAIVEVRGAALREENVTALQQHEFRARCADGTWVWFQGSPAPLRDEETGDVVGVVTALRDTTARRAMEAELRRKGEQAEAAAVAKAEFLANMSHEIRTPLTGIIGFSDLLGQMQGLPGPARDYVERITTSGRTLLAVVNDILDFSKLEAGQVELDPQPFDTAAFLGDSLALVSTQAQAKGLELALHLDDAVPARLTADSGRLRQVMLNLLTNAIKFTDAGDVRVSAGYDPVLSRLSVAVSDTGVGIPADRLEGLFQRFYQVDGSVSRRHGGTGLGLSICKTLVGLMGGDMAVSSVEGQGSTFSFWIDAPPASAAAPTPARGAANDAPAAAASARILVVDDLEANRHLLRALLTAAGHRVDEASGGAEAVRRVEDLPPYDLIFMDLQMPGMDGFAAARAIRALGSDAAATPIVALSANVLAEHVTASAEAGMNDHIGKPIVPAELLGAVARWATAGDDERMASTDRRAG